MADKLNKKFYKQWWFWMLVFIFVIILILCNSNTLTQNPTQLNTSMNVSKPTDTSFPDGNWIVGTDIKSGTYRSSGQSNCYYARLSGFGGTTDDIIANENTNTSAIITIVPTDKGFLSKNCGTWVLLQTSSTDQKPTIQKTTNTKQQTTTSMISAITPIQNTLIESNETISQKNAVKAAKNYLNYSAFSHDGLIAQLEYEQFSHADAVYGVDNSGANWDEQAIKSAQQYMKYSAFSRGSLIKQLEYEKFTQKQAEYGANAVGL